MSVLIIMMVSLFSVLFLFYSSMLFILKSSILITWSLFKVNSMSFQLILLLDWMSLFFVGIILFISSMVFLYSTEYMSHDKFKSRFFIMVVLFIISMMLMVLSPNMISILIGWDGLGIISYCLVIYYSSYSSYNFGMITMLCNRVGDVCFLLIIGVLIINGSWNMFLYFKMPYIVYILMMGCFLTKSAQMPFSPWLPKAMAAPTPVSSLVHSSTLVTAGIYLMIRHMSVIPSFNVMLIISSMTMLMAGVNAMIETDLKKIIAFSTLSQLGFMFSIMCMNQSMLSFFHLINHALFKSLLFLSAGYLIHNMKNMQDIKSMGMINIMMPFPSMCLYCSTISLCGLPFLTGFYSKDLILETMMTSKMNLISILVLMLSTILTVSYSVRLIMFLTIKLKVFSVHSISCSYVMMVSMTPLLIMSVMGGSGLSWVFFDSMDLTFMSLYQKTMILMMIVMGSLMGKVFYNMFYSNILMGFISSFFFTSPALSFSSKIFLKFSYNMNLLDKGWKEFNSSILTILIKSTYFNKPFKVSSLMMLVGMILLLFIF